MTVRSLGASTRFVVLLEPKLEPNLLGWLNRAGDELGPARPGAIGRGLPPGFSDDLPHCGRCDSVPETANLTVYGSVAPCGVLDVEAQHESEVRAGDVRPVRLGRPVTVNDLVDWYLGFARDERGLEH